MKISKALKMKNRLAGDIAILKQRITENNVTVVGHDVEFDVSELYGKLLKTTESLVVVKTAIAISNGGSVVKPSSIHNTNAFRIYEMAEIKGIIEMLRGLDTKHGKFNEGIRYVAGEPIVTEYRACFTKPVVDGMVAGLTDKLEVIQDAIDAFNATTDFEVD